MTSDGLREHPCGNGSPRPCGYDGIRRSRGRRRGRGRGKGVRLLGERLVGAYDEFSPEEEGG